MVASCALCRDLVSDRIEKQSGNAFSAVWWVVGGGLQLSNGLLVVGRPLDFGAMAVGCGLGTVSCIVDSGFVNSACVECRVQSAG